MKKLLGCFLLTLSSSAWAQDSAAGAQLQPPPADELKRAIDYLENGKDSGPVLLDLIPCSKVDQAKGSSTLFTCLEPVSGAVKKGTTVQAWTQWFCPRGGKYEDITIQSSFEGEVRNTSDVVVEGLGRTRTWRSFTLSKPGKWQLKVMRAGKELGALNLVVEK
jgi:hypothetical protein